MQFRRKLLGRPGGDGRGGDLSGCDGEKLGLHPRRQGLPSDRTSGEHVERSTRTSRQGRRRCRGFASLRTLWCRAGAGEPAQPPTQRHAGVRRHRPHHRPQLDDIGPEDLAGRRATPTVAASGNREPERRTADSTGPQTPTHQVRRRHVEQPGPQKEPGAVLGGVQQLSYRCRPDRRVVAVGELHDWRAGPQRRSERPGTNDLVVRSQPVGHPVCPVENAGVAGQLGAGRVESKRSVGGQHRRGCRAPQRPRPGGSDGGTAAPRSRSTPAGWWYVPASPRPPEPTTAGTRRPRGGARPARPRRSRAARPPPPARGTRRRGWRRRYRSRADCGTRRPRRSEAVDGAQPRPAPASPAARPPVTPASAA